MNVLLLTDNFVITYLSILWIVGIAFVLIGVYFIFKKVNELALEVRKSKSSKERN